MSPAADLRPYLQAANDAAAWFDISSLAETARVYSSFPAQKRLLRHPELERFAPEARVRHQASHQSMGTVFSIVAYGPDTAVVSGAVKAAFEQLDQLDRQMSHYRPESEISAINRTPDHERITVSLELFNLLKICCRYSRDTGGMFDITTGQLTKAWGFFQGWGRVPSQAELNDVLGRTGYRHVYFDESTGSIGFARTGIELNLGAVGKGYAVDCMGTILRRAGIARALISSGTSSILALGSPPGKRGWEIILPHQSNCSTVIATLRMENLALSVSGGYENCFERNGELYSHILDPRTGIPAKQSLMTAVIGASATETDILSTAFFVGGLQNMRRYLDSHSDLAAIASSSCSSAPRFWSLLQDESGTLKTRTLG